MNRQLGNDVYRLASPGIMIELRVSNFSTTDEECVFISYKREGSRKEEGEEGGRRCPLASCRACGEAVVFSCGRLRYLR